MNKNFLLGTFLFALLMLNNSHAATDFAAEVSLFVNNPPLNAVIADLDDDGDNDVVISGDNGLSVAMNTDSNGTFSAPVRIGTVKSENDQVADLNGDGELDILSIHVPGPSRPIVWHRNTGTNFTAAIAIRTENSQLVMFPPTHVDGDSDLDLLWYDGSSKIVEWMSNTNGAGSFASPLTIQSITNIYFPTGADLNSDGIIDFIAVDQKNIGSSTDDELVWRPGQMATNLSFGSPISLVTNPLFLAAVGFVNADTNLDLVLLNQDDASIYWLRNEGGGTFSVPLPVSTNPPIYTDTCRVVDFDQDGFGDIMFASLFENAYWCRHTNGLGGFAVPVSLAGPFNFLQSIAAAPINADTKPDLIIVDNNQVGWRAQAATSTTFGAVQPIASAIADIRDIAGADLDGDGDRDILFGSEDGFLFAIEAFGTNGFGTATMLLSGQINLAEIHPTQLDGEDGIDLITLRTGSGIASWHAGDGLGSLGSAVVVDDFLFGPSAVTVADFDGNGSRDIAIAFTQDDLCSWYPQNPTSHVFGYEYLAGNIESVRAIGSGDLDGDGDIDIATAGYTGTVGVLYIYTNMNGAGNFSAARVVGNTPDSSDHLEVTDIDGDGDLDLVVGESDGLASSITALLNNGAGAFPSNRVIFTSGAGLRSIDYGDIDLDGDIDMVSADSNSDVIYWHENNGSGYFSSEVLTRTVTGSPFDVALADVDGDVDIDVIHAYRFDGIVSWFRNDLTNLPPAGDPLTLWAWSRGVSSTNIGPLADGDDDDVTLLEEFAFNMNPLAGDAMPLAPAGTNGLPVFGFAFDGGVSAEARYIRRRDAALIGLTYHLEAGSNLVSWISLGPGTATLINSDYERVLVDEPLSGPPSIQFLRHRIQYIPPVE